MSILDQVTQFLGEPVARILAITALIGVTAALVAFLWRHYDLANRQVPELKKEVGQLEADLKEVQRERDELRRSAEGTDALLKAIGSIPGEIRQITRDVFISYDEDSPSTITQIIDGQAFQWRITVNKEEDGSYSGMVGHRLFGSSLPIENQEGDEKSKEQFSKMRSSIDQMGLFINAADRINLSSRGPQQIASAESISSLPEPPENGLEIYLLIERNEDQNRRWRCALIATMRK